MIFEGMWTEAILALGLVGSVWVYQAIKPPPPKICGSKNGSPVTSPRIKLSDGRHLAYKERGVPKENAKYKVIVVHGFNSSKDIYLPISEELIDELDLYILTFDRAGYGESDPNPIRSVKSEAFDVQELADQLQLGPKFYMFGVSIGSYTTWACLRYIPNRLAGVGLIAPVVNYWWPSFPAKLSNDEYKKQPKKDQVKLWIAHHAPGLLYWWMSQKWFTSCSIMARDPAILNKRDFGILKKMLEVPNPDEHKILQQGKHESLHRDLMVSFGEWEYDPMELKNPFPDQDGAVQLWQGREDVLIPFQLQRYLAKKLPWIKYYEVPDGGHLILHDSGLCASMFKALLLKEEPTIM